MILYIHPLTQMFLRSLLPMSLPALINRLPKPVLGKFEEEVTRDDLLNARIVLLDIHWYLSMHSAIKLSHRIKEINPRTTIIAGGLSASIFFKQILRDSKIDYIVRGDAEIPLKKLVETILSRSDVSGVPNVVSRDFCSPRWYALTARDMDESDYLDISFFPSLQRDVFKLHRNCHRYSLPLYPFLTTMRGCPLPCKVCYGSPKMQKKLFNRSMVVRSAEKVQDDLTAWSNDPRISFVNIYHDFITSLPSEYSEYALGRAYNLNALYEFFRIPSPQGLNLLNTAFQGGTIVFHMDRYHSSSDQLSATEVLIARIKQAQEMKKFDVRLYYAGRFMKNPQYKDTLRQALKATGCTIARADYWWIDNPVLGEDGLGGEKDYRYFLRRHNRYTILNITLRTGEFLHRYFPGFVKCIANKARRFF